jgi:hypothetical protein
MERHLLAVSLTLFMLAFVSGTRAQSTFGSIVGTVKDSSGAAVPAAAITAREIDENTSRASTSDSEGLYEILNLNPGHYEITVAKSGFASTRIAEARLEARQTIHADLKLVLAPVEQTVLITGIVPLINTENPVIADTKTFEQITELPLNYRGATTSPFIATIIIPGVQHDAYDQLSLGGGLPAQIEYTVDGISTHSSWQGPNPDMYPSTEMLSEFRVTSVNNNAEFGQMGDVTVATRGGTNKLHGSALWYHQNAALDATIYGSAEKPKKVYNTFGASLRGPVYLPGIYRGRDRTFFFVDYEGNRQPGPYLDQFSVPTAAMRTGDLTGVPGGPAVDPLSGAPFPGNHIPENRMHAVASTLLGKFYPLPNYNFDGTTNSNYRRLFPNWNDTDGYDIRIDHVLSPRQQMFARWSWKQMSGPGDNGLLPTGSYDGLNRNFVLSHNYSILPNLFNEFRFGFGLVDSRDRFPILGTDAVATLGLRGLDLSNSRGMGGFPSFDFSDGTGFSTIGRGRDGPFQSRSWQYTDNVGWILGRHTMKFGADLRLIRYQNNLSFGDNGEFGTFYFNQASFSGNAFADFLLGLPNNDNYGIVGPNLKEHALDTHLYAQDEWRVNDHLTVSFGLRWSLHPPMTEGAGNITNFDRTNGNVIVPDLTLPAAPSFLAAINACPGTTAGVPCTRIVTASQAGLGPGLRRTYYGNWAPRVGFAWRPFSNQKTVLRSGFGIFTQQVNGFTAWALTGIHTSDVRTYQNFQAAGTPPLYVLPQISGGPLTLPAPGTESFGNAMNPSYKDPRTYQWSFTAERELPRNTAVRLSYIGSQAVGLNLLVDLNQQHASTVPYSASRRPYVDWNNIGSFENLGYASYNGLQAEATHRFGGGLFFQSSYVYSKNIGNAGSELGGYLGGQAFPNEALPRPITDRFNTRLDRGNLAGSRRQRFLLTAIYRLPVGKGRAFAGHMNRLTNAVLGGWDLSTITLVQSGPFETPLISARLDQSNTDIQHRDFFARPDRIGNGNLSNPTPDHWWDVTAFAPTPKGAGRFGNAGVGILEGTGTVAVAGGLFKRFSITEKLRMRLEATFTNVPNHPNFAPPSQWIDRPGFGEVTGVQRQENSGNRVGQVGARLDF